MSMGVLLGDDEEDVCQEAHIQAMIDAYADAPAKVGEIPPKRAESGKQDSRPRDDRQEGFPAEALGLELAHRTGNLLLRGKGYSEVGNTKRL